MKLINQTERINKEQIDNSALDITAMHLDKMNTEMMNYLNSFCPVNMYITKDVTGEYTTLSRRFYIGSKEDLIEFANQYLESKVKQIEKEIETIDYQISEALKDGDTHLSGILKMKKIGLETALKIIKT